MKTIIQTPSEELLEFAMKNQRDDNTILEIIYDTK